MDSQDVTGEHNLASARWVCRAVTCMVWSSSITLQLPFQAWRYLRSPPISSEDRMAERFGRGMGNCGVEFTGGSTSRRPRRGCQHQDHAVSPQLQCGSQQPWCAAVGDEARLWFGEIAMSGDGSTRGRGHCTTQDQGDRGVEESWLWHKTETIRSQHSGLSKCGRCHLDWVGLGEPYCDWDVVGGAPYVDCDRPSENEQPG